MVFDFAATTLSTGGGLTLYLEDGTVVADAFTGPGGDTFAGVTVSAIDERIYCVAANNDKFYIYDFNLTLLATVDGGNTGRSGFELDSLCIPCAGKVWAFASYNSPELGGASIYEYDKNGGSPRVVVEFGPGTSVGRMRNIWSAVKVGSRLFYVSNSDEGANVPPGPIFTAGSRDQDGAIHAFDLVGLVDLPDIVPMATAPYIAVAKAPSEGFFASIGHVGIASDDTIERRSANGSLAGSFAGPSFTGGLTVNPAGDTVWVRSYGDNKFYAYSLTGTPLTDFATTSFDVFDSVASRIPVLACGSGSRVVWPIWLQDSTFLVGVLPEDFNAPSPFLRDFDIVRYNLAGKELQRFTYSHQIATEGLYGFAASLNREACDEAGEGRLYLAFDWDNGEFDEQAAILVFNLKTGAQVGDLIPLQEIVEIDQDVAAGFVHLLNPGPSSDGSFEDTDPDHPDEPEEPGDCPAAGPGGSSFDGAPDGDRVVQPGGFPAVYVPPDGEGVVATAVDPDDPQDLATLVTPLVSADLTVCDETVYRLAKSTYPRPGEAQMDPRVLRFSPIPYPFADRFGSLPAQTWELEIADEDGFYRGLLEAGENRFWKRWKGDAFVEDDATGRLLGLPRQRVARGRCVAVRGGDQDQSLVLVFTDEFSRHDSPYSLDRELPHVLIGDVFAPGGSSPDLVSVPEAGEDVSGDGMAILGGEANDEYRAAENPPVTPIGIQPLVDLGDVEIGGEIWRAYLLCLYACYSIPALFGSNLDPTCPASVRLDPDLFNGNQDPQFLVPGFGPWDAFFANKYIEVTRDDKTYWVTMIFGRGPISDQHVNGTVPLTCNPNGVEDVGDGTGNLIDDAARLAQWLIDVPLLKKQTSGLYGDVASYGDGIAMIRTSDTERVRDIHNARLSDRYRAAFSIRDRRAGRDWIADLCVSWGIQLGLNHHGQITMDALDVQASLSSLRTFTDMRHIREEADGKSTFRVTSEFNAELENSVAVNAGIEPATGRFTVPTSTVTAPDSIRDWGDVYAAQPLTLVGVNRPDVAGDVVSYRLIETQDGITRGTFDVDLAGGTLRGGELLRVTHYAGIGLTGWRNRVLRAGDRSLVIDDEGPNGWQTRVSWQDVHQVLVRPGTDSEPRFGFKPIGSWQDETGWIIGSSESGTAYRAG